MRLAHYQLEQIEEYISSQDIYYTDTKYELTDHIASAVEDRMASQEISFSEAFGGVIAEIDPEKIQRKRMLQSFALPFWSVLRNGWKFNLLVLLLIVSSLMTIYSLTDTKAADKWLEMALVIGATMPALLALADRKHTPYKMSFFMMAVLGSFMSIQLLVNIDNPLPDSIMADSLVSMLVQTLGFFLLASGYRGIFQAYQKTKKHNQLYATI